MSLRRYLVYRKDDGLVINCIIYDGFSPYQLDAELAMELVPENVAVDIGWTYDPETGKFIAPQAEESTEAQSN